MYLGFGVWVVHFEKANLQRCESGVTHREKIDDFKYNQCLILHITKVAYVVIRVFILMSFLFPKFYLIF